MTCNGGGSQARRLWHDSCAAPPGVESFVAPLADSSFCGPVSYLNSPAGFLLERRHVQSTRRRRRKSLEGSERDERGCIDLPACRDARVVPFGLDDTFRGGRLLPLKKRLLFAWCALTLLHGADPARAQFTDAHNYDNTPVGVNQLELGYAFMHANASIDTSRRLKQRVPASFATDQVVNGCGKEKLLIDSSAAARTARHSDRTARDPVRVIRTDERDQPPHTN